MDTNFATKFVVLSLPCTVTFVDKEEGQPSMRFCYANKFPAPLAPIMFSPVGKEEPPPPLQNPPLQTLPPGSKSPTLLRSNVCLPPPPPPRRKTAIQDSALHPVNLCLPRCMQRLPLAPAAGPMDVFTLIGMREQSTVLVHQQPTDWVLFNSLIDLLRTAEPQDHGMYLPALEKAKEALLRNPRGDCGLLLLFLSDGRPSDAIEVPDEGSWFQQEKARIRAWQALVETSFGDLASGLGRRLTVGAVGLGGSGADFPVLESIVHIVRRYGSTGIFSTVELDAGALTRAFTSLATSLTATKMELTSVTGSRLTVRDVQRDMQAPLWDGRRPTASWYLYTRTVERLVWRDSKEDGYWKRVPFIHPKACGVAYPETIFGEGAERMVWKFREVDASGKFVGREMVAKQSRFIEDVRSDDLYTFHRTFCETQKMAQRLARAFNKQLAKVPGLPPDTPRIRFLACSVYTMVDVNTGKFGVLAEPRLDRKRYQKWNNNDGYVVGGRQDVEGRRLLQANPEDPIVFCVADIPQAFSHFTYEYTKRKLLVCDLQGVLQRFEPHPMFLLTDPAIHYKSGRGRTRVYGRSDQGAAGIEKFFKTHKCSALCRALSRRWVTVEEPGHRPTPSVPLPGPAS